MATFAVESSNAPQSIPETRRGDKHQQENRLHVWLTELASNKPRAPRRRQPDQREKDVDDDGDRRRS